MPPNESHDPAAPLSRPLPLGALRPFRSGLSRPLPRGLLRLSERLEESGIRNWLQGDCLIQALGDRDVPGSVPVLLCDTEAARLADALPHAVVTAAGGRRFSVATETGPADLLPVLEGAGRSVENALLGFGFNVWALGYRPATEAWLDPAACETALVEGRLEGVPSEAGPRLFAAAPRRYFLAARLIAEHRLEPGPALITAARAALPEALGDLPRGAPARREISRTLLGDGAAAGLRFFEAAGIRQAFFAGNHPAAPEIVAALPRVLALRWAAWIAGQATQASLRRWKMPHAVSHEVESLLRVHPIDRSTRVLTEAALRRLWKRLGPEALAALIDWRRCELMHEPDTAERSEAEQRLSALEHRFAAIEAQAQAQLAPPPPLALSGADVMAILECGPGRSVGDALRHLAEFAAKDPRHQERAALETELRAWAAARKQNEAAESDASERKIS